MPQLREYLTPGEERVGFILRSGEIVEVKNVCEKPEEGFEVSGDDLLKHLPEIVGTWHTHPSGSSNLSMEDMAGFLNWPDWEHFIVGQDGVTRYVVSEGDLLVA
ncbi:hypothetical protein IZ6_25080 [Terrihabitans soli]|uniref:JAB domain-containing protein n=1 Tax=Terrihabitans soli TaxID=708113 RepID=A0A6S6QKE5_9HYPH|nr:hypothetical protein [Terrihabitans soli]BCJ91773.1 hypothetical protein IZ6_25080 [Terrihabitans soli]